MPASFQQRIADALDQVRNPRIGRSVVAAEMIHDIATTTDGRVRLTFLLSAADDATLVRDVRQALERVDGVTDVRIDVRDPAQGPGGTAARAAASAPAHGSPHSHAPAPAGAPGRPGGRAALPVLDAAPKAPPRPSAPVPVAMPHLGRIIAVSSGKGGVGKSTVATNLAVALARTGARVGLMDADIYGPNIPRMMGVNAPPPVIDQRIQPLEAHGVKVMSLGFIIERDQPAIWRGPIVMKVITQFLQDVQWGTLDFLLVDMPPGTGDAQLSLVQAAQVSGAVIVTTPQEVAVGDALRGAKMFERVGVPVLGIIENMSYFECPHCGKPTPIFGSGGGRRLADELGIPLLGEIPLYPQIHAGGDSGTPIVVAEPDAPAAKAMLSVASRVAEAMGALAAT
jgi:ATP-binding protein involved in chromosome partitioning